MTGLRIEFGELCLSYCHRFLFLYGGIIRFSPDRLVTSLGAFLIGAPRTSRGEEHPGCSLWLMFGDSRAVQQKLLQSTDNDVTYE